MEKTGSEKAKAILKEELKLARIAEIEGLLEKVNDTLLKEELENYQKELKKEKKEEREKARGKRSEERKKEDEETKQKIRKRDRQIFWINLFVGISGTLALILYQNDKPWWSLFLGILTLVVALWLKARFIEDIPTIGGRDKVRFFFALGCWVLGGYLITRGFFSIPFFKDASILMQIITFFSLMFGIIGITWKNFTFDVPQWTGMNLFNYFTGKQTTFLPGFYFKFPWELIKPESTHSLKSTKEDTQNRNYPTGGGTVLEAEIMVQFAPDPFNLVTFEGIDNKVITQGLMEHVSSVLLTYVATGGRKAKDIRGNIEDLHEAIRDKFGIDEDEQRTLENPKKANQLERNQSPIERSYGIIIIIAKLVDLDFEENYQKILTANRALEEIQKMAAAICQKSGGKIEWKDAWDQAMIVSEKATGRVIKITGDKKAIPMVNTGGD